MQYIFILVAYLSGAIPYGLILSRIFGGVDIRKIGSGNIGTTNVLRTGHKGIAAATLFCDVFKGFLPVYMATQAGIEGIPLFGIAYAAVLGHIYPIWLKFQGGKGVATSLGIFWALSPPLGVFTTFIWLMIGRFAQISSLSALSAFALSPLFAVFALSWQIAIFCFGVGLLIFWTHRSNILRLIKGEETKLGKIH